MNRVSISAEVESMLSLQARETARYMQAIPGRDGSCQFEIHAGGADVGIWISPSGEITSILFERKT